VRSYRTADSCLLTVLDERRGYCGVTSVKVEVGRYETSYTVLQLAETGRREDYQWGSRVDTQVVIYLTEHDVSSHQSHTFQAAPRHAITAAEAVGQVASRCLAFNLHSAQQHRGRILDTRRRSIAGQDTPVSHTTFTPRSLADDASYLYFSATAACRCCSCCIADVVVKPT